MKDFAIIIVSFLVGLLVIKFIWQLIVCPLILVLAKSFCRIWLSHEQIRLLNEINRQQLIYQVADKRFESFFCNHGNDCDSDPERQTAWESALTQVQNNQKRLDSLEAHATEKQINPWHVWLWKLNP